jgi:hypothetical protein
MNSGIGENKKLKGKQAGWYHSCIWHLNYLFSSCNTQRSQQGLRAELEPVLYLQASKIPETHE